MSRAGAGAIDKHIPEQVTYYLVPHLVSAMGVIGTPVVVAPGKLSEKDLYELFRGKYSVSRPRTNYIKVVIPNTPLTKVTLVAVDWDGKFCIRYRLEDDTEYLTDLHGTSLFEAIKVAGVKKGGRIPGSFIWASTSSTKYMRLIHVDGKQYKNISHKDDVGSNRIIKKRDLIPGALYETYSGKQGVYLGSVNTISFPWEDNSWAEEVVIWRINRSQMLWYESENPTRDVGRDFCNKWAIDRFSIKGSHSYRKLIRIVTTVDQDKLLTKVRRAARQYVYADQVNDRFHVYAALMNVCPKGDHPIVFLEVVALIEKMGKIIILPGTTKEELPRFLTHKSKGVRREAQRYYNHITGGTSDEKDTSTE